jgi:hypothetical protein
VDLDATPFRKAYFMARLWLLLLLSFIGIFDVRERAFSADLTPSLYFTNTDFDLGEVAEGAVLSHEFIISNAGPGVLKIISVQPG